MPGIFRHPPQPWQLQLLAAGLALPGIVSPGGIASAFAAGTPSLAAVATVSPGGIASGFSSGSFVVSEVWIARLTVNDPQTRWWAGWRRPMDPHQNYPPSSGALPFLQTVAAGGIASGFAAGAAPYIQATIGPAGIPSGFVSGNLTLSETWYSRTAHFDPQLRWWQGWRRPTDPHQNYPLRSGGFPFPMDIVPFGIPTKIAIGVPRLSGPLAPTGIASAFAAGLPFINEQQIVSGAGAITSGLAFGHAQLAQGSTLRPSGIASGFVTGTAKLTGGPRRILPAGIPPGYVGIPSVAGGAPGLEIFIAGMPMFRYNRTQTTRVQSQTIGRWTAEFELFDPTGAILPKIGQTVLVMEFGRKLFAGCLSKVVITRVPKAQHQLLFACTAQDKSGICDHRVITGASYDAAQDGADVIRDIVAKYLNGEGITTQGVPATLGAVGTTLPFNFNTVTSGFDQIATLTGTVWWVDVNGVLNFSSFTDLPGAPFNLDDSSSNWRNLSVEQSLIDYRNKEYAISNLNAVPGGSGGGGSGAGAGITESYTLISGITDPFTGFHFGRQVEAQFHGLPDSYIWLTLPVRAVLSVKVNGISYPIFERDSAPTNLPAVYWGYVSGEEMAYPVVWLHEGLAPGDIVEIQYIPTAAAGVETGVALDPGGVGPLAGTCGSGVYEHVTPAVNLSLKADLDAVAAAVLARSGGVPTLAEFETDNPGLAPGQKIQLSIPNAGISKTLLITGVDGSSLAVDLGHSSSFRWKVKATSNQDPGNWIKWYERLIRKTDLPLPVDRFEQATFILGPGGNLSQGTLIATPDFVGNTGLLFELMIAAAGPPIDQDLTVTLIDGNVAVASIVLPAGTPANQLVDVAVPASPAKYLYAKDVLNVNASYRVTGPNPKPAFGVAFRARWKY